MNDKYVNEANEINRDYLERLKDHNFKAMGIQRRLSYYQRRYPNFAKTFPITLRYMIEHSQYSSKAFRKYLKRFGTKRYKNEDEFCERQADYVKYLYMELNNHYDERLARKTWQETYDLLRKEIVVFKESDSRMKKKNEELEVLNAQERRAEVKEKLIKMSKGKV